MCEWKPDFDSLTTRVDAIEREIKEMRSGYASVNANIETLSQQIANLDKRIIEEKQKWGETLRGIVKWTVRSILAVVVYAAGVNLTKTAIASLITP